MLCSIHESLNYFDNRGRAKNCRNGYSYIARIVGETDVDTVLVNRAGNL
jgi:hypothetical protein